jgi:hypothetical protein
LFFAGFKQDSPSFLGTLRAVPDSRKTGSINRREAFFSFGQGAVNRSFLLLDRTGKTDYHS